MKAGEKSIQDEEKDAKRKTRFLKGNLEVKEKWNGMYTKVDQRGVARHIGSGFKKGILQYY
jgi:hypothetical protein